MEQIVKKLLMELIECFSKHFDIGETIIECCELIKDDIEIIEKDRAEFFCTLWNESEKYNFSEQENNILAEIEATIVMMCGGKLQN